jgi:hypothetical protein
MTIFKTEPLRKFKLFIDKFRVTQSSFASNVFINFEDNSIYFTNDDLNGKIPFSYEGDSLENFWVDAKKFFYLINSFDELEIKEKTFYSKEGQYLLPTIEDDSIELPEYDNFEGWNENYFDMTFNKEFFDFYKKAKCNINEDDEETRGLFIQNNSWVITNRNRLFLQKTDEVVPNIVFDSYLLTLLDTFAMGHSCKIYTKGDDNSVYRFVFPHIVIQQGHDTSLQIPQITSDSFIKESYYLDNYISLPFKTFSNELKFLNPLLEDVPSKRLFFTVLPESKELKIEIKDNNSLITKKLSLSSISDQEFYEDCTFVVSNEDFIKSLDFIEVSDYDGNVLIYLDNDKKSEDFIFVLIICREDLKLDHYAMTASLMKED